MWGMRVVVGAAGQLGLLYLPRVSGVAHACLGG